MPDTVKLTQDKPADANDGIYAVHNQIPSDIACVDDYQTYAKQALSHSSWEYIDGGSADELTLSRNRSELNKIGLMTKVLSVNAQPNTHTTVMGQALYHPMLLGPVAYQQLAHPLGEVASLKASSAQDVGYVLSTLSSISIEQVADNSDGSPLWFQLYIQPNFNHTLDLIRRAEKAGFSALVITVDAPINGLRNREQRAGFRLPEGIFAVNLSEYVSASSSVQGLAGGSLADLLNSAPTWDTIAKIQQHTYLPVIIKGILSVDDALMAKSLAVDGIVVSNHGGRVLDGVPATIEVLGDIRQAVGPEMSILFDSGIRRGSDIFKAIALGADAVLIGRPIMYALATAGPLGVAHMLRLLKDEFEITMALCGCKSISDITSDKLYL